MESKELEKYLNKLPYHKNGCETDLNEQSWFFVEFLNHIGVETDGFDEQIAKGVKDLILHYSDLIIKDYELSVSC